MKTAMSERPEAETFQASFVHNHSPKGKNRDGLYDASAGMISPTIRKIIAQRKKLNEYSENIPIFSIYFVVFDKEMN